MSIYDIRTMGETIKGNEYVGRGIVIGKTEDGTKAAIAYFIMGRSENSRNRVFKEAENSEVIIFPFDESKVEDPSLIIYSPIKKFGQATIVTNGDQTQTIYEYLYGGKSFEAALETRCFEPDGPNWTPRISGMVAQYNGDFTYKMSILKSGDAEGTVCNRFTFSYAPIAGLGHFIHTYVENGNPIPTFQGEPERVSIPNDIDEFFNDIWENLDEDNKISLYVRYIDLATGEEENRMVNKNQ
ncbi:MAG: IMP cyclohydrolase [Clostridia bacterium]|nr:IMP cyclohydrolase [Clostridia bacterium]MBP5272185.1 IMP cyclohydrolase [Clostridia bacterium]